MDYAEFEKFCVTKGLRPELRATYDAGTVYIAMTEREWDRPNEYPAGYYQGFFMVASDASQGKMDVGRWVEFDGMHDLNRGWTEETRKQARVNATLEAAKHFIELNVEAGRYGGH